MHLKYSHTVPADCVVVVEWHQAFWAPFISVLTTVIPHTDSLVVSTKIKAGLVTEDDPLPFWVTITFWHDTITVSCSRLPILLAPKVWLMEHTSAHWMSAIVSVGSVRWYSKNTPRFAVLPKNLKSYTSFQTNGVDLSSHSGRWTETLVDVFNIWSRSTAWCSPLSQRGKLLSAVYPIATVFMVL